MRQALATETLTTGERLVIECVQPPDPDRAIQIEPFLAHKPTHYRGHIAAAFACGCDDLETRFYIGLVNGEMVGNIMTVEAQGVGIFGHVHTRQDQRRKGICAHIMRHQMADFRRREGHVLLLGTGYQSVAYNIYHSFGFRDWEYGRPGLMRYVAPEEPDFEAGFLASPPARAVEARWQHWPLAALLASTPNSDVFLRSLAFDLWGTGLLEGPFCRLLHERDRPGAAAAVLEAENGAVLAVATCAPDPRWRQDVVLLDLFSHASVAPEALADLLHALPLPVGRLQCYADPNDATKIAALEAAGLRQEAVVPRQFRAGTEWRDALLYGRG